MQQVQPNQSSQYREYSRTTLLVLDGLAAIDLFLFLGFIIISGVLTPSSTPASGENWTSIPSQIGLMLLFGEIIFIMTQDWRGAITLRGAAKGYTFHKGQRVSTTAGFVCLYLFFPYVMLPIYLMRATADYQRMKALKAQQIRHQVASMEAELGIMPPLEGACRTCQKPLVVGADFCQYCGTTVLERPKVCPSCATTASPDARFCPRCRTALA